MRAVKFVKINWLLASCLCVCCLFNLEIVCGSYTRPLSAPPLNTGTTGGITPEFKSSAPKSRPCGPLSERSSDFQAYLLLLTKIWVILDFSEDCRV